LGRCRNACGSRPEKRWLWEGDTLWHPGLGDGGEAAFGGLLYCCSIRMIGVDGEEALGQSRHGREVCTLPSELQG